eukprot:COSAG01_NODE_1596_length_9782_cov_16.488692_9_plen_72_part_00
MSQRAWWQRIFLVIPPMITCHARSSDSPPSRHRRSSLWPLSVTATRPWMCSGTSVCMPDLCSRPDETRVLP